MQSIKILAFLISMGSFQVVQATYSSPQEDGGSSTGSSDDSFQMTSPLLKPFKESVLSSPMTKEHSQPLKGGISSTSSSDDDSSSGSSDESSSNSFAEFSKVFALLSIPHEDGESSTSSSDNDSFLMTKEHFQPTNKGIFSSISVLGKLHRNQYNLLFKVTKKDFDEIVAATGLKMHFQANEKGLMDLILEDGYFGQARLAQDAETGEYVAVKFIPGNKKVIESLRVGDMQQRLAGEPHILPFLDYAHYTSTNDETIKAKLLKKAFGHTKGRNEDLLLQFAPFPSFGNGELLKVFLLLLQNDALKTKIVTHVAYAFVTGLMNIHNKRISHLDFQLLHLQLSWQGDVWISGMDCAEQRTLLFGGFGDRRKFSPERLAHENYLAEKQENPGNIKANDPRKSYSGPAADSFAAGLAILELILGERPPQDCFDERKQGLFKVIDGMTLYDPKERWSTVRAHKALKKLLPKESPKELFAQFEQAVQASLTESAKYKQELLAYVTRAKSHPEEDEEKQYAYYQQISPEIKEIDYTDFLEEGPFCTDIPDDDEPHYTALLDYDHTLPPRRNGKGNQEKAE